MKNIKTCIFSLGMVFLLASCSKPAPKKEYFKLYDPEDTSMLSENCKRYIDDMREQEKELEDPYKWNALDGEGCVDIDEISLDVNSDERKYLDKGDVNGQNKTVNNEIPDRSDKSLGVELKFEPKEDVEAEEYKVLVSTSNDFEDAKEISTKENSVRAKNLFVNTKYYWKVVADDKESDVHEFTTGDYPRWIDARPMFNVRDMGGYMTDSGKRVKQGLIYRTGEVVVQKWNEHLVTYSQASQDVFRNELGFAGDGETANSGGVEIDLRKVDNSENEQGRYKSCAFAINGDIEFKPIPIGSYGNTISNNRADIKTIFEIFANADEHKVFYHCYGGADRTGTIGFLLNGLLGVSYTDMVIDFELTSYSSINNEHLRSHLHSHQTWDHFSELISGLKNNKTNGYSWSDDRTMKENIEEFLTLACGIEDTTIEKIRDIMLED